MERNEVKWVLDEKKEYHPRTQEPYLGGTEAMRTGTVSDNDRFRISLFKHEGVGGYPY